MKTLKRGPKPKPHPRNRIVSIRTDEALVKSAKALKINISGVLHEALFEAVHQELKKRAA